MNTILEYSSYFATALTTLFLLPQIFLILKTKNSDNISIYSYICLGVGAFIWAAVAIDLESISMFFSNLIISILSFVVVYLIKKYKNKDKQNLVKLNNI